MADTVEVNDGEVADGEVNDGEVNDGEFVVTPIFYLCA
jgi:hypothetical protein